jgi:DNA-binding PadR family transcriptional regulator
MPHDADATELGRFAEPAMLVLVSLSSGPKHGYAIMADVGGFGTGGIGPGTLYAVLARLEQAGLIEGLESDDRRRPYRLTAQGASALAARLDQIGQFVSIGRTRLGREGSDA